MTLDPELLIAALLIVATVTIALLRTRAVHWFARNVLDIIEYLIK